MFIIERFIVSCGRVSNESSSILYPFGKDGAQWKTEHKLNDVFASFKFASFYILLLIKKILATGDKNDTLFNCLSHRVRILWSLEIVSEFMITLYIYLICKARIIIWQTVDLKMVRESLKGVGGGGPESTGKFSLFTVKLQKIGQGPLPLQVKKILFNNIQYCSRL